MDGSTYYLVSNPFHGKPHEYDEKVSPVDGEEIYWCTQELLRRGRFALPTGIGLHAHYDTVGSIITL